MLIFIIVWSICIISELLLIKYSRTDKNSNKDEDKGSLKIILITIAISSSLGVTASIVLDVPMTQWIVVPYIGLFITLFGMTFRFLAIKKLGRFFTSNVTILNNHILITNGLFKRTRHPSYLGNIIYFTGIAISLNNWISLIVIVVPITIALVNRIRIEEKLLHKEFGKEYEEYVRKTNRLFPKFF